MTDQVANFCIRCGKLRIVVKTWKECIKGSILIHTSFVCPDGACQKIVDKELALKKEKREAVEKERIQRAQAHKDKKSYNTAHV